MNPAHSILVTYRDVLNAAKDEVNKQMGSVESSVFDAIIKEWATSGTLDTSRLTDQGKLLFFLGMVLPTMIRAQDAMEQYHGILANPPQTLAWVAKQRMEQFQQAVQAAQVIEAAMEENPEWDVAQCFLDQCDGGPCQKVCSDCVGHCLGHS